MLWVLVNLRTFYVAQPLVGVLEHRSKIILQGMDAPVIDASRGNYTSINPSLFNVSSVKGRAFDPLENAD